MSDNFDIKDLESILNNNSTDLNNDIDDSLDETEEEEEEEEEIKQTDLVKATSKIPVTQEATVDIEKIYGELDSLVKTGGKVLNAAQYLVETTPESENIASTAMLLSSIKDIVREFTRLYHDKIRFDRQKELEVLKIKGREKLIKLRHNLEGGTPIGTTEDVVGYNQEEMIKKIIELENKEN